MLVHRGSVSLSVRRGGQATNGTFARHCGSAIRGVLALGPHWAPWRSWFPAVKNWRNWSGGQRHLRGQPRVALHGTHGRCWASLGFGRWRRFSETTGWPMGCKGRRSALAVGVTRSAKCFPGNQEGLAVSSRGARCRSTIEVDGCRSRSNVNKSDVGFPQLFHCASHPRHVL